MGIFQNVMTWLTEKSNSAVSGNNGFYSGQENAQQGEWQDAEGYDGNQDMTQRQSATGYFGSGPEDYDGRSRYKSKEDQALEAQLQANQAYLQPNMSNHGTPVQNQQQIPQQMNPQMQQTPPQQMPQTNQQGYARQDFQASASNIVAFPGTQQTDGATFQHVEYVIMLRGRNECKNVIGYIKANASVFLNMEFIASDNERQRCVDILSGAAYTLGCKLNKISQHGIYLISSPAVNVIMDPVVRRMNNAADARSYARQQQYNNDAYQEYQPQQDGEQMHAGGYTRQQRNQAREAVNYQPQQYQQAAVQNMQQGTVSSFSSGSPTMRFQVAYDAQQPKPSTFGTIMTGNPAVSSEAAARY